MATSDRDQPARSGRPGHPGGSGRSGRSSRSAGAGDPGHSDPEGHPTVVVCRPAASAAPLVAALAARGLRAMSLGLQHPAPPGDGGVALADALGHLDTYHWLVATSVNGVRAAVTAGLASPLPPGLRLAAVGPATAQAWSEAGLGSAYHPPVQPLLSPLGSSQPSPSGPSAPSGPSEPPSTTPTAADLARSLPTSGEPQRVLAVVAERAGTDLERILTERGFAVDRVTGYRMVPTPVDEVDLEAAAACRVAVVTAPSVVERLVELQGGPAIEAVVAIGPRTAAASRRLGFATVVEAAGSDADALAAAVAAHLAADRSRR